MAITITTIQAQDSLSASRLTINSNFASAKAGIDSVQALLNPTTSILSGVKSATITDASVPFSTTIFTVGKASSLLGNVIMGTVGASTSVLFNGNGGITVAQSALTLTNGSITMSNASSSLTVAGNISAGKEIRLPGYSSAFLNLVDVSTTSVIDVQSLKYVYITNLGATGASFSLGDGSEGQIVDVVFVKDLVNATLSTNNFVNVTSGISLSKSGDSIKVIYDSGDWYLMNYFPASFPAGATTSSILFTYNL